MCIDFITDFNLGSSLPHCCYRFLCQELQDLEGADVTPVFKLLLECIRAFPCKFSLPYQPALTWLDYSFHNEMLSLFLRCLPKSSHTEVYEQLLSLMPTNAALVQW
jgi:hypothetical protein